MSGHVSWISRNTHKAINVSFSLLVSLVCLERDQLYIWWFYTPPKKKKKNADNNIQSYDSHKIWRHFIETKLWCNQRSHLVILAVSENWHIEQNLCRSRLHLYINGSEWTQWRHLLGMRLMTLTAGCNMRWTEPEDRRRWHRHIRMRTKARLKLTLHSA